MSQERNGPDYVPARFSVLPLRSAALDLSHLSKVGCLSEAGRAALERQGGYAVHVWSSNWLTGHVTVARDGTIRQVTSAWSHGQAVASRRRAWGGEPTSGAGETEE